MYKRSVLVWAVFRPERANEQSECACVTNWPFPPSAKLLPKRNSSSYANLAWHTCIHAMVCQLLRSGKSPWFSTMSKSGRSTPAWACRAVDGCEIPSHVKPLSADIYRRIESFQGFLGGAGFRPSTVGLSTLRQALQGCLLVTCPRSDSFLAAAC